uniref:Ferredoxin-related family protein n=1 Tax=Rhizophora mucronata TaxID=61149 RepID=A0A2P2Q5H2_RHIMU
MRAKAMTSFFLLLHLFSVFASGNAHNVMRVTNNPADQLVAVLNSNRTANNKSSLYDNPGLGCIALQYIKAYQGDCGSVGGPNAKKPDDSEFADTFAPNCGVLGTTLKQITGRLLGCQTKYVSPARAFSEILIEKDKSLEILYNKNHTEVGAAVTGTDGGSPYFWCLLFSNGKRNSSFALEGGVAKITRPGCFSGASDECSHAKEPGRRSLWSSIAVAMMAAACVSGL